MKKVMVSSCLLGEKCRYNGSDAFSQGVLDFIEDMEVISFCPELLGGMETPREPAEIKNISNERRVITSSGKDVTSYFRKGAAESLKLAKKCGAELIILKSKSPSCGLKEVYDGTFSGKLVPGSGLTGDILKLNNSNVLTEDML